MLERDLYRPRASGPQGRGTIKEERREIGRETSPAVSPPWGPGAHVVWRTRSNLPPATCWLSAPLVLLRWMFTQQGTCHFRHWSATAHSFLFNPLPSAPYVGLAAPLASRGPLHAGGASSLLPSSPTAQVDAGCFTTAIKHPPPCKTSYATERKGSIGPAMLFMLKATSYPARDQSTSLTWS